MPPPVLPSATGPVFAESSAAKTSCLLHVKAVDVVEPAVPGFGDHRQRPLVLVHSVIAERPGDDGVAHHADAVGVGDARRALEKAGFLDPGGAGHLAIAVEAEPSGVDGIGILLSAGQDDRDAGTDRTLADLELPSPRMSVVEPTSTPATSVMALSGAGSSVERDAKIASANRSRGCALSGEAIAAESERTTAENRENGESIPNSTGTSRLGLANFQVAMAG